MMFMTFLRARTVEGPGCRDVSLSIIVMELEIWRKGILSELIRARRERKRCSLTGWDIYSAVPTCRTGRLLMKRDGCPMI